MTIYSHLKTCLIATIIFLLLDFIWLGSITKDYYAQELGSILQSNGMAAQPFIWSAIVVYIFLIAGIIIFPQATDSSILTGILGLMLGLIIYGVYDFANLSLIGHWSLKTVIIDVIWGGVLCGFTAGLTCGIRKRILVG